MLNPVEAPNESGERDGLNSAEPDGIKHAVIVTVEERDGLLDLTKADKKFYGITTSKGG
jgi:hypothetical protein